MKRWIKRQKLKWWLWRNMDRSINKRASVESYLFNAARGKKPLPDAEKCRQLANKLGIPDSRPGGDK